MKPGTRAVLDLLRQQGPHGVTPLDALASVGSFRLGARIWELKSLGYDIETELARMPSGKRVARYRLIEKATQIVVGL